MLYEPILIDADLAVIDAIETLRARLRHRIAFPQRWHGLLRRVTFARNIRGSNSIEGYNVTVDDALAAAVDEEPLEASEADWRAVSGYRHAMTYVLQLAGDEHFTFSTALIRSLHYMMLSYDLSKHPGTWRPGWVAVRDSESGAVVYEGPDADLVPELMEELAAALQSPDAEIPDIVHAAMAHLNLVLIHPFSDGNGRMARCIQTLVLARSGVLSPVFSSIEEYLGHRRNTQTYYDVLGAVARGAWSPHGKTGAWVKFCLTAHYRQAVTTLNRFRHYERLWAALDERRARGGLPERFVLALWDAAIGLKVRNATYRSVADISSNLASRDLKRLVDEGFLIPRGKKRGSYYEGVPALRELFDSLRDDAEISDPYELDLRQAALPGTPD